jgi:protein gp37
MGDKTKISWADATWNPIIGCSKISAGCQNCYAEKMAFRLATMHNPDYEKVVAVDGDGYFAGDWQGKTVFVESALTKPLHWRKPRKIFVCSMSDLFHESVPFTWIEDVMGVIEQCPQHTFFVLTKRPMRMTDYFNALGKRYELSCCPNLHLGVTVENQDNVGRIADLIRTPAAKRFVSFEPLLGETDVWWPASIYPDGPPMCCNGYMCGCKGLPVDPPLCHGIDYAFIGCESGPKARLCSLDNIRYTMGQCRDANIKIHVKQIPLAGKCNKDITQWPPEFQVREI